MYITLKYLVLTVVFVNLLLNDKYLKSHGFPKCFINLYIRSAGGLSHWDQYLSLSTAFRHSCFLPLLTSKDNDTMQTTNIRKSHVDLPRLYNIYYCMKDRCFNPKNLSYHRYGGRGITVCEEWKNDKEKFFDWSLINGYEEGLQIDRIDNDGNYEPGNCRWVSVKDNCRNTSKTIFVEYGGERKPLIEWCEILGISYARTSDRLNKGWAVEDAFSDLYNANVYADVKKEKILALQLKLDQMLFFFDANSIVTKYDKLKNKKATS
jgi:hypothetical protein